jgi:hypothetical protein
VFKEGFQEVATSELSQAEWEDGRTQGQREQMSYNCSVLGIIVLGSSLDVTWC